MKITLVEPYFTGSHRAWAEGLQAHSKHEVEVLALPGNFWKWRMHGGAVALADSFVKKYDKQLPDLVLGSDMLDLSTFYALSYRKGKPPKHLMYFHENQLTYPWSATDPDLTKGRDIHYGFINYVSGLCADGLLFNSDYHRQSFLGALPDFLKKFPDHQGLANIQELNKKSQVLPLGIDLQRLDKYRHHEKEIQPTILWNHRWEYDKNPEEFFKALFWLKENEMDFRLIVLGESFSKVPPIFEEAKERLSQHILHWGYAESLEEYAYWLWKADIMPITAVQDFFGISAVEAMYCDTYPLFPQRLAYREHLPPAEYHQHFYEGFEDLTFFLEHLILNVEKLRHKSFQSFVKKYDWRTLIRVYDETFERQLKK